MLKSRTFKVAEFTQIDEETERVLAEYQNVGSVEKHFQYVPAEYAYIVSLLIEIDSHAPQIRPRENGILHNSKEAGSSRKAR